MSFSEFRNTLHNVFHFPKKLSSYVFFVKIKFLIIIQASISPPDEPTDLTPDSIFKVISLLASRPASKARFALPAGLKEQHSVLVLPPEQAESALNIVAVVDPVSRAAQKLGPLLSTLRQVFNCKITLYLNSVEKNSDMPLKRFVKFCKLIIIEF